MILCLPTMIALNLKILSLKRGIVTLLNILDIKVWLSFIIDTGHITIQAVKESLYLGKVIGSEEDNVSMDYIGKIYIPFYEKNNRLIDSLNKVRNLDTVMNNHYRPIVMDAFSDFLQRQKRFIKAHPDKFVSLDILAKNFKRISDDSLKFYFNLLSGELRKNSAATDIKYRMTAFAKNMEPGAVVHDFRFTSVEGKKSNLYNIQAKYKLISFWASWCGPCLEEMPSLRKIYSHFKNVAVISFSLDSVKSLWIEASRKNKIAWYSFSDLEGPSGQFARYFSVQEIPLVVLLNEKNEIVKYNPDLMEVTIILHLDA